MICGLIRGPTSRSRTFPTCFIAIRKRKEHAVKSMQINSCWIANRVLASRCSFPNWLRQVYEGLIFHHVFIRSTDAFLHSPRGRNADVFWEKPNMPSMSRGLQCAPSCTKTKRRMKMAHERPLCLFAVWMLTVVKSASVPTGSEHKKLCGHRVDPKVWLRGICAATEWACCIVSSPW
jgi:hypothetical protein